MLLPLPSTMVLKTGTHLPQEYEQLHSPSYQQNKRNTRVQFLDDRI
ncbi:hypothetical protein E1A91_D08G125300v1 [Gossypium mustelinum]|uniref:Uncharacterized protein n=1 Tax=Gossypium mustelinum TaxID=34275 RepID=A0A5D2TUT7_GOSMU|nr:hypothetical protein E1A91_D08G125300v1 [Gossypium mustelinum]